MRALIVASVLCAAASPAVADDTFEAQAAGALRVRHVDDIVWAFTAPCDGGDDTHRRQCRRLRDARHAELANATLLVEAERDAFVVGAWSPAKKSATLTLSACIRCTGIEVDGKTWYVVGTKDGVPPPRFERGTLRAGQLHDTAKTFPDDAAAKRFAAGLAAAKVQLLVKVPKKPTWTLDGKSGVTLELLGYRVVSPCDGSVVLASPTSGPAEADKAACAAASPSTKP